MDAVLVGLLVAVTLALGMALWSLLVRPEALLSRWDRGAVTDDGFFDEHPAALTALKWALGGFLFLLGFLVGLATAFLGATP